MLKYGAEAGTEAVMSASAAPEEPGVKPAVLFPVIVTANTLWWLSTLTMV